MITTVGAFYFRGAPAEKMVKKYTFCGGGWLAIHDKGHEYLYLTSDVDSLELYLTKTDEDIKIDTDSTEYYRTK